MGHCKACDHNHEHEEENENLKVVIIRLIISLCIFFIALLNKFPSTVNMILFIISYLLFGYKVLLECIENIFKGKIFDENFLMTIATIGAFALNEPVEAVSVMIFYNVGEIFSDVAVDKSKKSIMDLINIKAKYANLKVDNTLKTIEPEELKVDDIIIVKPGEKIAVDGIIVKGKTAVDTSTLTGEAIPKQVIEGDKVFAGYTNINSLIEMKVINEFKDTSVAQIIELVESASDKKSKTENFITKFAKIYTPIVTFLALIIGIIIPIILKTYDFNKWVHRALVFLVTSCPCAMVISIPLGYFIGIGVSSKKGVLIKGSNYLDMLTKIDAIALDKTGTITKGKFSVSKIVPKENISEKELLNIAAIAESYSNHPVAKSILSASEYKIEKDSIRDYEEIPGCGIKLKYNNDVILAGNSKLMDLEKIKYEEVEYVQETIVYIAKNQEYMGLIIVSDTIKEDSIDAIKDLKQLGIEELAIITGDNENIAKDIGNKVEIERVYYNLLPEQKVEKVNELKKQGKKVMAIGDGINDSPVLANAYLGVAMGKEGADLAIDASDIVIMDSKLSSLVSAIKVSKRTKKIVIQNIVFAIAVKLFVLVLGAFGVSTMLEAVFADVGVTFITILNCLRISSKRMLP